MKRNTLKTLLLIFSVCLCLLSFPHEQTNNIGKECNNYFFNSPPPSSNNSSIIISIGTTIISLLSIIALVYNVKRQIKSVEKNIVNQFKIQEIYRIREYTGALLIEILKPDGGRLEDKEYVSEKHKEMETRIIAFLDEMNPVHQKLINCITKFKREVVSDKNAWASEILRFNNEILKNNNL